MVTMPLAMLFLVRSMSVPTYVARNCVEFLISAATWSTIVTIVDVCCSTGWMCAVARKGVCCSTHKDASPINDNANYAV